MKVKAAEYLQKQFDTSYKRKPLGGREKDMNIHIYDLIDFCPRAYALAWQNGFPFHRPESIPLGLSYTFHLGNRIQDLVTDQLKAQRMIYGTWACRNPLCQKRKVRQVGFQDPKRVCEVCGGRTFKYVDTSLRLELVKGIYVVGHIDTLPALSPSHVMINEVKSIKKEDYDRLSQPVGWHTRQAGLYPWLLDRKATVVGKKDKVKIYTSFVTITYATKGYHSKPFKVYPITPDKNLWKDTDKKLATLKRFLSSKAKCPALPKKICDSDHNMMARDCVARMTCFDSPLIKGRKKS